MNEIKIHCRNCMKLQNKTCRLQKQLDDLHIKMYNTKMFEVDLEGYIEMHDQDVMMEILKALGENCNEFAKGAEWI